MKSLPCIYICMVSDVKCECIILNRLSFLSLYANIHNLMCMDLQYYATSREVMGSTFNEVIGFFNWPNPSSCTMVLGSTQTLTQMSTRNLPGDKGRLVRKADKLTAICELIV
jgi:hypothetical protein